MKIKHVIRTMYIMLFFSAIWILLESVIYGTPESRVVDDIILLMMTPFFYIASIWFEERAMQKQDTDKRKARLTDVECFDDMDADNLK